MLQGWDLRGRIGIEFTYLNFSINGGSTPTKLTPGSEETKEDFYHQSMPLSDNWTGGLSLVVQELSFSGRG